MINIKVAVSDKLIPIAENMMEIIELFKILDELDCESVLKYGFDPMSLDIGSSLGFLPMATQLNDNWVTLFKHHHRRCILKPEEFIINKKIIKLLKDYTISINTDFEYCIDMINKTYDDSWLYKDLVEAYRDIYYNDYKYNMKIHSFILKKGDKIVAGEIGYNIGKVYTSLTGYHTINNSGNIQLLATAMILQIYDFKLWDLGMELPYKLNLGGRMVERDKFCEMFKIYCKEPGYLGIKSNMNVHNLVIGGIYK